MSKKQMVVIKKIIVQGGGHHGGSWKVALADFMTALMAFFLVMWLVGQSEETKKAVSDYFSTPSVIEYNFQNYGAEITLEKLFLDLVNEPLKAAQSFLEPADKTPNVLDMGSAKVVAAFMADKLTDSAQNVSISQDGFEFEIPDTYLFERGTAQPNRKFIEVMDRLTTITSGLQDSEIKLTSMIFTQTVVDGTNQTAKKVAHDRLELISNKIRGSFEHSSNTVYGGTVVKEKKGEIDQEKVIGYIHFSIRQKPDSKSKKPQRKIEALFDNDAEETKGFENMRDEIAKKSKKSRGGNDPSLRFQNPADEELQRLKASGLPDSEEE